MAGNSGLESARLIMQKKAASTLEEQTSTFVPAEMVYILFCSFAVFFITPGISMYYSGSLKRKNVVQVLFQAYMTTCTVGIIWYLIGYSLACSPTSTSVMIGDLKHAALYNEEAKPMFEEGTIPSVVNFCFNVFFAIATVQIFLGAIGERGRILPSQVVAVMFTIVVYAPLAYWVWGGNGWLLTLGELDFAGGGPVHIASGVASLVYSFYLGPRGKDRKMFGSKILKYNGHNYTTMYIGVTLIWGAWLCFNSGTLLAVNTRTGYIFLNTILASMFACTTFVVTDKILTGKFSIEMACDGVIVGLVNITPSCGYYKPWAAAITSIITAVLCRLLYHFNEWTGIDDYSRSWIVHGVGGIIGGTLTGIFASKTVAGYDGATEIPGGWVDGNFRQLGIQIAAWVSIVLWTSVMTYIILFIVDHIPGLKIRATDEGEEMGMDMYEMSETLDEFTPDADFLLKNMDKIKVLLANEIQHPGGEIEVLDGTSVNNSGSQSSRIEYDQKV